MKVLQLISSQGMFGAEHVVVNLSRELSKFKEVRIIIGIFDNLHKSNLDIEKSARGNGLSTITFRCNGRIDYGTVSQLRQFIREQRIDVLHSHGYKSNIYGLGASFGAKNTCLATCHNWLGESVKMRFYSVLDRILLRYFIRIVAVSDEVKNKLLSARIKKDRVRVVRNGIPLEDFSANGDRSFLRRRLGIADEAFVFGSVGRLSAEKGHRSFLKAFTEVVTKYPRAVALIIGDGPLGVSLRSEFAGNNCIFTGQREDVSRLYDCLDVFVLPSLTEGLPMALLEAGACKLPIIASRVGDVSAIIADGESGLLVQPESERQLATAMTRLLQNPDSGKAMGIAAYKIIVDEYSAEKMASNYYKLYLEALEER